MFLTESKHNGLHRQRFLQRAPVLFGWSPMPTNERRRMSITEHTKSNAAAIVEVDAAIGRRQAELEELQVKRRRLTIPPNLLSYYDMDEKELLAELRKKRVAVTDIMAALKMRYPAAFKKEIGCRCTSGVVESCCDSDRFGDM